MIVPFATWAGRPLPQLTDIPTPSPHVVVHHGAAGNSSLATLRRYLQHHTLTNGWQTIGYQFCIAGGRIYEGRGAGKQGAHAAGRNRDTQGIVIVGDYDTNRPADEDLNALTVLLRHGRDEGWWQPSVLGHRDVGSTSCPGRYLQPLLPDLAAQAFNEQEPQMTPEQEAKLDALAAAVGRVEQRLDDHQQFHLRPLRRTVRAVAEHLDVDVEDGA